MKGVTTMNDDEYAEYIDNDQICILLGVPCRHGIPCCNDCSASNESDRNRNANTYYNNIKLAERE